MKFCPVVPEICRGQVHGARKERKKNKNNNNNNKKRSKNNKSPKLCLGDLIIIHRNPTSRVNGNTTTNGRNHVLPIDSGTPIEPKC